MCLHQENDVSWPACNQLPSANRLQSVDIRTFNAQGLVAIVDAHAAIEVAAAIELYQRTMPTISRTGTKVSESKPQMRNQIAMQCVKTVVA
eukprot:4482472-Amphidinium_carterae.1